MPCVVERIALVLRAIVRDALDNHFGIITASEGPLGVRPVRFGLALVSWHYASCWFIAVDTMPWRLVLVFVHDEIAKVIGRVRLLERTHNKLLVVFPV